MQKKLLFLKLAASFLKIILACLLVVTLAVAYLFIRVPTLSYNYLSLITSSQIVAILLFLSWLLMIFSSYVLSYKLLPRTINALERNLAIEQKYPI